LALSSFARAADFQSDWWHALEVNLRAPIALIHARGFGIVITTTQSNGVLSVPFMTADPTVRSAMISFHHGLDHEVRPKGVYSYVVFPGTVASYMHDADNVQNVDHFAAEPRLEREVISVVAQVVMEGGLVQYWVGDWDVSGAGCGSEGEMLEWVICGCRERFRRDD
jgi:NAD(P)-dependent dehydrogenase (short-subunit alcohol dehydrogenase family)